MKNNNHGDKNGFCVLDETIKCTNCGECDICDLDPTKICDNCGKCLDQISTDEKGFVKIPIDKIDMTNNEMSLDDFYSVWGLNDDDDNKK